MIRDIITFKYSDSMYGRKELYRGKIVKEYDDRVKVKILRAMNQYSDDNLEGDMVIIKKTSIVKGYTTESVKRIDESLKFMELKKLVKQWAIQNNLLLTDEEKSEMNIEDDDFIFVDNMIEFEKLRKKLGSPIKEEELTYENNKVRVGLFRDFNANEFVAWYIIQ
jgi:hypothetical protein